MASQSTSDQIMAENLLPKTCSSDYLALESKLLTLNLTGFVRTVFVKALMAPLEIIF
jgi:hypothetical protein